MPFDATYHDEEPTREEIDQSEGPLLLEFGANWCGHCQAASPVIEGLLNAHPEVQHIRVADGKGKRLGRSFRVKLWPTLLFLKDGQVIAELIRPPADAIGTAMNQLLSAE